MKIPVQGKEKFMAEKKHKIVSATTGKEVTGKAKVAAKPVAKSGNAGGLRFGAILLWIVALVFEVLAILLMFGKIVVFPKLADKIDSMWFWIAALVIDFICVVIGSQLWKKANHIDPASQKQPVKFWFHNNFGVIVSALAFIPFIILLLTNKDADKKSKTVGTIVAVAFMAISGLASYDWNPVSQEALEQAAAGSQVYWTEHGKKFHLYEDCQALDRSEELVMGSAEQATESGRGTICKFCEKRYEKEASVLESAVEELPEAAGE